MLKKERVLGNLKPLRVLNNVFYLVFTYKYAKKSIEVTVMSLYREERYISVCVGSEP